MASGSAKLTGKLSARVGTTGPRAIHLVNGLYDATSDGAPVVAITGLTFHDMIGMRYIQAVNTPALIEHVARFNVQVRAIVATIDQYGLQGRVRSGDETQWRLCPDAPPEPVLPQAPAATPQERSQGRGRLAGERPPFAQELKASHPDQPLEWWFQDEARLGQQGTLTAVWAQKGSRPEAIKQTEYQWVYLYAAVNPRTGVSSAMLAPTVNTAYMNEHLKFISRQVAPGSHAILVLDQGWHVAKALEVPENITLLHLPPYSPDLNPVERVWAFLRSHYLSNRVFKNYDQLFDMAKAAWNCLDETRLQSICRTAWIERAI